MPSAAAPRAVAYKLADAGPFARSGCVHEARGKFKGFPKLPIVKPRLWGGATTTTFAQLGWTSEGLHVLFSAQTPVA